MENKNTTAYSTESSVSENMEDGLRRVSVKNGKEDTRTLQDLKWTLIPESQREEAKKHKSCDIMRLYQSADATEEQKQWCRDIMVAKYERYIYELIHSYFESYCPKHVCEFFQYGVIGLINAMNANYDPESGFEFMTYMNGYVKRELSTFASHLMHGQSAHYSTIHKKVLRAQNELLAAGIEPTCAMIALSSGLNESSVMNTLEFQKRTDFIYLDGLDDVNNISESFETPALAYEKKEREKGIHDAIDSLPETRAKIVKLRFGITTKKSDEEFVPPEGMTFRMIAEVIGLPTAKIKSEFEASLAELKCKEPFRENYEIRYKKVRNTINRMDSQRPSAEELRREMQLTSEAVADEMEIKITASGNIDDFSLELQVG